MHPTTQYANDVVFGKLKPFTCKWEQMACKRHLNDLERVGSKNFPYVFDESRANRIIEYFRICRHVRGVFSGEPIELPMFAKFDVGNVFGWVHKKTGKRRFKTAYIRVARGNIKSTLMSGIANFGMTSDALYPPGKPELARYEAKPEVVCGAVDKEQAKIVWEDARQMALASPEIMQRLNVQVCKISHKTRGGELKRLSKDTKNKDGGAPCIIIIDEYHAHPTALVKNVTSSGKGKRSQCLEFIITTAGEDAENKPCKIEDDIVKKILSGDMIQEKYFGVIREIDDEDDPHDETKWIKANPIFQNDDEYSQTLLDEIRDEHDLAFDSRDNSKIREWMIKRVDRWQDDAENRYMTGIMEDFKKLGIPRSEFLELTKNRRCYSGLDLSKSTDLTADGNVFSLDSGKYAVCAHGYMPMDRAKAHEHSDRVPYKDWARDGWATLTEGNVTDYNYILENIKRNEADYGWKTVEFCYDPYNATHFIADLKKIYGEEKFIEVRQGVQTLSAPTKFFRELVLQGRLIHDGSPLLVWCVSNALEIIDNNGNIKLSKKHKDDSQRIDLLAAIINALSRAMANEEKTSVYNTRGMRSLAD